MAGTAAAPIDHRKITIYPKTPDFNATNVNSTNTTILQGYQVTPAPIRIQVEMSDTRLSASKGEMAVGPRTIGFSVDPVLQVILVIALLAVFSGGWYLLQRKKDRNREE